MKKKKDIIDILNQLSGTHKNKIFFYQGAEELSSKRTRGKTGPYIYQLVYMRNKTKYYVNKKLISDDYPTLDIYDNTQIIALLDSLSDAAFKQYVISRKHAQSLTKQAYRNAKSKYKDMALNSLGNYKCLFITVCFAGKFNIPARTLQQANAEKQLLIDAFWEYVHIINLITMIRIRKTAIKPNPAIIAASEVDYAGDSMHMHFIVECDMHIMMQAGLAESKTKYLTKDAYNTINKYISHSKGLLYHQHNMRYDCRQVHNIHGAVNYLFKNGYLTDEEFQLKYDDRIPSGFRVAYVQNLTAPEMITTVDSDISSCLLESIVNPNVNNKEIDWDTYNNITEYNTFVIKEARKTMYTIYASCHNVDINERLHFCRVMKNIFTWLGVEYINTNIGICNTLLDFYRLIKDKVKNASDALKYFNALPNI